MQCCVIASFLSFFFSNSFQESTSDDTVIVHVGGTSTNPTSSGSETTISYHENVGTEFNEVQHNLVPAADVCELPILQRGAQK